MSMQETKLCNATVRTMMYENGREHYWIDALGMSIGFAHNPERDQMYVSIQTEGIEQTGDNPRIMVELNDATLFDVEGPRSRYLHLGDGRVLEGRHQLDGEGNPVIDMATCGQCGFTWNDALITELTPASSGRCPNEYSHTSEPDFGDIDEDQTAEEIAAQVEIATLTTALENIERLTRGAWRTTQIHDIAKEALSA